MLINPGDIQPVDGPAVWTAGSLLNDASRTRPFSEAEIEEIDRAQAHVERLGLAGGPRSADEFPLPTLGEVFGRLRADVDDGRGLLVLRGLPVDRYGLDSLRSIYRGIGLHFGIPVDQTPNGDQIIDVRNEGAVSDQILANGRSHILRGGYSSSALLPFHTDGAHTVALLCIRPARKGGTSYVSSAAAVHNALLAQDPRLAAALYQSFPVDRRSAQPPGEPGIYPWEIPVFSITNGRLNCVYDRKATQLGCERTGRGLTALERDAFDAFDDIAASPRLAAASDFQSGDIQLINNFTVLHSRTNFEDWPEPNRQRHLLRLWLHVPDSPHVGLNKLHLYTRTPAPTGLALRPAGGAGPGLAPARA